MRAAPTRQRRWNSSPESRRRSPPRCARGPERSSRSPRRTPEGDRPRGTATTELAVRALDRDDGRSQRGPGEVEALGHVSGGEQHITRKRPRLAHRVEWLQGAGTEIPAATGTSARSAVATSLGTSVREVVPWKSGSVLRSKVTCSSGLCLSFDQDVDGNVGLSLWIEGSDLLEEAGPPSGPSRMCTALTLSNAAASPAPWAACISMARETPAGGSDPGSSSCCPRTRRRARAGRRARPSGPRPEPASGAHDPPPTRALSPSSKPKRFPLRP